MKILKLGIKCCECNSSEELYVVIFSDNCAISLCEECLKVLHNKTREEQKYFSKKL